MTGCRQVEVYRWSEPKAHPNVSARLVPCQLHCWLKFFFFAKQSQLAVTIFGGAA